jgi:prepilin-type N-terminal cleavage/methylation domain-containing protein
MTPRQAHRTCQRAFTLAELLAVVVIIGVLATLATAGYRKYVLSSRSAEAVHMIGSIEAAQESYRAETFSYLDVTSGALKEDTNLYPQGETPSGGRKWAWENSTHPDAPKWFRLGIHTNEAVRFGYACRAGSGQVASYADPGIDGELNWPTSTGPWYVVRAVADHDPGGKKATFVGSSFTSEIYSENEDD